MDINNLPKQIPKHLLSNDKKVNALITKQHLLSKRRAYTNNILQLLHSSTPGYIEAQQHQQTVRVSQQEINKLVNVQNAANQFDLDLEFGDYRTNYSRNGSSMLLTSSMGHVGIMDWRNKDLKLEINLKQQIRDASFLHSDELFACVQNRHLFIYDNHGVELHKLPYSDGIQYLPYHFLLSSYCNKRLRYYDISSGQVVADHSLKNKYKVIRQNPTNAIIALGSTKGTIEWWTPGMGVAALSIFAGSSIIDVGFYKDYMVSVADTVKVWDSRTLKVLDEYKYPFRRPNGISISATGMIGINYGYEIEFFKNCLADKQPYLRYKPNKNKHIVNSRFVPFEDIMGVGLHKGFSSIIVPGSGDPNYSTFENSPFITKKQQKQSLVHKLLEKLPPETITVNPNLIGTVDSASKEVIEKEIKQEQTKRKEEQQRNKKKKNKTRGKDSIARRHLIKQHQKREEKRREIDKIYNLEMVARRAERVKKETEAEFLESLDEKGFDPVSIIRSKRIKKNW